MVLAAVGLNDFVMCQITSNPYSDLLAIPLTDASFTAGSLHRSSFARPGKLFTAHHSLIRARVGWLTTEAFQEIQGAVITLLAPRTG